jgi:hypothetical protein
MLKAAIEKGDLPLFKFIASRDKKRGRSSATYLFFIMTFLFCLPFQESNWIKAQRAAPLLHHGGPGFSNLTILSWRAA